MALPPSGHEWVSLQWGGEKFKHSVILLFLHGNNGSFNVNAAVEGGGQGGGQPFRRRTDLARNCSKLLIFSNIRKEEIQLWLMSKYTI